MPMKSARHKPSKSSRPMYSNSAWMELDVVLRTVLRHVVIQTTSAPGEKVHNRGVAFTPKKGGRVVVYRRAVPLG
jgi:hypothetical protein